MNVRGLLLMALGVAIGVVVNRVLPPASWVLPAAAIVFTGTLLLIWVHARRQRRGRPTP